MCICVFIENSDEYRYSYSLENDMKYPDSGDTGSWVPLDVGAGN